MTPLPAARLDRLVQQNWRARRVKALLEGRLSPSIDDVVELAAPTLRHRMALNFAARAEGVTLPGLIDLLCAPYR